MLDLFAALAFWALLFGLAAHGIFLAAHGPALDFGIYCRAALRFLHAQPLYPEEDGPWVFKYAPAAAFFFAPLALLPVRLANLIWNLSSVAALGLSARALSLQADPRGWPRTRLFALLALAQPLLLELRYGQVDLMLLALLVFAIKHSRDRPALSGLLAAAAILLKPPALLVLAVFALRRHFRAIGATALSAAALWLPVFFRYGLHGTRVLAASWIETLARTTLPWALGANPQGLPTVLLGALRSFQLEPSPRTLLAAQGFALLVFTGVLWRVRDSAPRLLVAACAGAALLSPLCWRANLVLLFPMLALCPARLFLLPLFVVGALVNEAVLSPEAFRAAMMWRPFFFSSAVALAPLLFTARAGGSPPGSAPDPSSRIHRA